MRGHVLTISASVFKAKCLAVLKALEGRKVTRVIVTRRGKPVAELAPSRKRPPTLWGAMRGRARIAPGVDLTEPVIDQPLDAERGILHR